MNKLLMLVFLSAILSSLVAGQDYRKVNCLTPEFAKEKIELAGKVFSSHKSFIQTASNEVGDTLEFTVFKHPWAEIKAVCKAVGDNCYIFVETAMWDEGYVDETDVEQLLIRFEEKTFADSTRGIFEMMLDNFGPVPDAIDNDPRVYIMVYDMGGYGDGSFFAFDQYTQEQIDEMYGPGNFYSNEKELLYLNARNDVSSNLMLSVAAHELEHMIHWNMDEDEESWIDEGCGELAMYHFGYPDPIVLFNMFPDNDLTMWDSGFADYVQTYLFMMYLYEQYGGTNTIKELLKEQANSINGVNNTLVNVGYADLGFSQVFTNWVIANYLDNRSSTGGIYGYENIALPPFEAARGFSRYPIDQTTGAVSPWAADYIWMNNGDPQTFNFNGEDNGKFHVSVIKIDTAFNVVVDDILLNDKQDGSYDLNDFGTLQDQIIIVVSNQASFSPTQYSFSSSLVTDVESEKNLPYKFSLLQNYPNPFNPSTTIEYTIPALWDDHRSSRNGISNVDDFISLKVFDILGRQIATLVDKKQLPGKYSVAFDASGLPSGTYFYQLKSGNLAEIRKMTLIK